MPIYAYKCTSFISLDVEADDIEVSRCDNEFEVFYRSISEAESTEQSEVCPRCGGTDKERLVNTGTSFQLKGRGWAKDGY